VPDPGRAVLAAPLYRMNLLTIGDFYKKRYGRGVEVLTTSPS
jgi:Na+/proline symporter